MDGGRVDGKKDVPYVKKARGVKGVKGRRPKAEGGREGGRKGGREGAGPGVKRPKAVKHMK